VIFESQVYNFADLDPMSDSLPRDPPVVSAPSPYERPAAQPTYPKGKETLKQRKQKFTAWKRNGLQNKSALKRITAGTTT